MGVEIRVEGLAKSFGSQVIWKDVTLTLPAGTGSKGLPLGIQLVGLRHADDGLLSTAAWVAAHLN